MTDEEIGAWTSAHDTAVYEADMRQSYIPTHLVTAKLREMRDHAAKLEAVRDDLQAARTQWPSGTKAAAQLAQAWREAWMYDQSQPLEQHAAAVLAALAQEPRPA